MSEDFEQECSVTRRSNLEQKRTCDRVAPRGPDPSGELQTRSSRSTAPPSSLEVAEAAWNG